MLLNALNKTEDKTVSEKEHGCFLVLLIQQELYLLG